MSDTPKRPREDALRIADKVFAAVAARSTWCEYAGSIRREKKFVGDVEIVAIPAGNMLYEMLDAKLAAGTVRHVTPKRWGQKMRSFVFNELQFDVFIQPDPLTMPVNFMIRTGSALFSQRMVTPKTKGGFMPDGYKIEGARVVYDGQQVYMEDEAELFDLWGMAYVEPKDRTDDYRPAQSKPVRPEASGLFSATGGNAPVPDMVSVTREDASDGLHPGHFSWLDPLPERFSGWSFATSPDAGTEAARARRIAEVRARYA